MSNDCKCSPIKLQLMLLLSFVLIVSGLLLLQEDAFREDAIESRVGTITPQTDE
ncbi:hypothetical protein [Rickettsiales endosymbiont of Peranema trichophorum]|uniref:hypothetical protein n=1 Tax=Rickettsiales endosymbiont of Peranema trichophorum TaxID=2486577 RepID=UPI0013EED764|nr:hypothetical protein [Rickettsiales endosymbiont of Peranema trichophorum]